MKNNANERKTTVSRTILRLFIIPLFLIGGVYSLNFSGSTASIPSSILINWSGSAKPVSAAGNTEWSQDAHDAQRSGYTAEEPMEPWTLAWTWNGPDSNGGTGSHKYNAPKDARTVTGGNLIYVPAGVNGLYALRKSDGVQVWHLTCTSFNATPAYDPATSYLYAGGADGKLYKLDSTTGSEISTYSAGSGLNRSVLLVGSYAYVLTDSGQLRKVNTANMSLAWMYAAGSNTSTPAAYSAVKGLLIYCTADLFVHAVRDADGTQQWKIKPTNLPAQDPFTFEGSWPVVAELHGLVFVRLNLGVDALYSGPGQGSSGGGVYPSTNADIRALLISNSGALENLFALDLNDGSQRFVPAVGYGGVEYRTDASASGLFLQSGAMPVVKVNPDNSEVAYIPFRSGQGSPPDGRWDSHMGEMVLDGTTIPGLAAGDLRYVDFPNSQVKITDEQTPYTMAGDTLLHAHWGASESIKILNRSASKGLSATSPITSLAHPAIIRRQQSCSSFDPATHQTSCGLTLFGDGRYWSGPGFWVYWNVMDPPTPPGGSYSEGVLPRYTYVSDGLMVVEGNGGDLSIFHTNSGSNPTSTPSPVPTATNTAPPTATRTQTPTPTTTPTNTPIATATRTNTPGFTPTRTSTPFPTASPTKTPTPTGTRSNTPLPTATTRFTTTLTTNPTETQPSSTATEHPKGTFTVWLPNIIRMVLPTPTVTPTTQPTETSVPHQTLTHTVTATPTPTGLLTRTATQPQTSTCTPQLSPTRTSSPTPTHTHTSTQTTAQPTATRTSSPQPTPTRTPTATPQTSPTGTQSSSKVSNLQVLNDNPAVYEKFEIQFNLQTSASNLDMPFDPNPPAGVQPGTGVTVNGLFSSDNWQTTITQPAFLNQPYTHLVVNGKDHFTPAGAPVWDLRFAPQKSGNWQYRLSVQDSNGQSFYPDLSQTALSLIVGSISNNPNTAKGMIAVSPSDARYFQFKDGTPFVGVGFNDGFSDSASVEQKMVTYQQNKMNFMRVWQSGSGINGSQWTSWASNFLSQDGYLPGTSFDIANTYNSSPVSMRLDNAGPCLYADFLQGGVPVEPNTTYQVSARVKVSGLAGPATAGEYGFVIKQGGWLGTDCVKPGTGINITTPITGSVDWTTVTGTYTTGSSDYWLGNLYLTRENASAGQVYIDEVHMYRASDPMKVDVLRQPYANSVEHFDPMNAAQWDLYIQSAEQHGVYLKLVIDEKNEWIRNHMAANGQMSITGTNDNFYAAPGTKVRWLEQAWWRYIIARWGYSTAIHSFEYINEGDPYNSNLYNASEAMARYFHDNDPSRHMVTTSFWSSFPNKEFWSNPQYSDLDYADVHAYISTGWGLDASFLPASMVESQPANIHSGNASAKVNGASSTSTSIVPRGVVIQGAGEWVIKYWMKTSALTATCPYSGTGSMLRLRWLLDSGKYNGGREGVVPTNSESKDYVCTSPAGTFPWTQFSSLNDRDGLPLPTSARIILTDNNPHELNILIENSNGTNGTAWIDDVQLIDPSGKIQPVIGQFDTTPMDNDTAWYTQAYGELFGGGSLVGAHKPLVRGETGVDFVGNQTFNPDLLKDSQGIWLHNNVWGQINDSGMADLFWWATETIPSSIFSNFMTFQNFMAGIPLTNGQYSDSRALSSTPLLRVIGQRDDVNGQMHLWIQNTQHNWKQVVNGPAPTPVSGTITLPNVASGNYKVEWWNTYSKTNPIFLTQTITANGSLTITLPAALADDEAVKIRKIP